MKKITNSILWSMAVTLIISLFSMALPVRAIETRDQKKTTQTAPGKNAAQCEKLKSVTLQQRERISQRLTQVKVKIDETQAKRLDGRAKTDAERSKNRETADTEQVKHVTSLNELAKTVEQKNAVNTYVATVKQINEIRRTAVDSAVATYRSTVDSLIASLSEQSFSSVETLRVKAQQAADELASQCAAGTTPDVDAYKTRLQAEKTVFTSIIDRADLKKKIAGAREVRKKAIEKAHVDAKGAHAKAVEVLKIAMKGAKPDAQVSTPKPESSPSNTKKSR